MGCTQIAIAIIFPPLSVLLSDGLGLHFLLSIPLTAAGYLPGLIHAIWRLDKNKSQT